LAERKFEGLKNFVNEYWVDRKNSLPENPSKVKKIAVIF
jgi:hypothetical protein